MWGIMWGDRAAGRGISRTEPESSACSVQTERGRAGLSRTLWESRGSPFKTAAFNRSATTPGAGKLCAPNVLQQGEAARLRCA
jgi:hypothetical protein